MKYERALQQRAKVEEFRRKHRIGLLTLLFTDLVGSTQLKQQFGDQKAVGLIQDHHALVRGILGGFQETQEIDTAGDSFFIVFARPSDAVRFSLLLQARLRRFAEACGHDLRDRIGLHIGEVVIEEQPEGPKQKDLYGLQVDVCARVMSLADGNQVLMTRSAFDNARQILKGQEIEEIGELSWLNHGPYSLKGVEEPLEICEVGELGQAILKAPADGDKAHRYLSPEAEPVLGWRPALGQVIPGTQWLFESKLGEGGFGEVWLGRHQILKERRVFKFCFRADRVRSLKREVTIFRLLKERAGNHRGIMSVREVHFDDPPFYIVMDYAEGQNLRIWCESKGGIQQIPLETRIEIVAQVAEALQAAHRAGVIHRDVKPTNILLATSNCESRQPAPEVKLADFGIGQVLSQEILAGITRAGFTATLSSGSSATFGTLMYLAPELQTGQPASPQSDIYSLGIVLYQLLVGDLSRPLTFDWFRKIDDALLREDLEKCLRGEPSERFSDVGQLAENLRNLEKRRAQMAGEPTDLDKQNKAPVKLAQTSTGFTPLLKPGSVKRKPEDPVVIHPTARPTAPTVADHELLRIIGQGSYGLVWLARNVVGSYRAVKIVSRNSFDDNQGYDREFWGIQRYEPVSRTHPALLNILQIGCNHAAGYFYYVMDLADDAGANPGTLERPGQTLNPHAYQPRTLRFEIMRQGRLPVDECIQFGLMIASALARLHSYGLVHRDIKPANIVFQNGVPKLADIGLVTSLSQARSYVGTAGYIPREGPGKPQADLYSLGKVLYEMLTGKDRLDFPSLATDIDQVQDSEKAFALNEIILKACDEDTASRYRTAEELLADLERLGKGDLARTAPKKHCQRTCIYSSDFTSEMLFALIPEQIRFELASDLGIEREHLSGLGQGPRIHTLRAAKRAIIKEHLTRNMRIGTIDEPGEYFSGTLQARWGCYGEAHVLFGGETDRTIVSLAGEIQNMIQPTHEVVGNIDQVTLSVITSFCNGGQRSAPPEGRLADLILSAVVRAIRSFKDPPQPVEILARPLLVGKFGERRVVLASPLYVISAD